MDLLSDLPDFLIHEILSHLHNTKEAVKTCVLSKSWTHQWTHVNSLCFDQQNFNTKTAFEGFVLHVLQHCQPFIKLRKFRFFCAAKQNQALINAVFDHPILYKLEELETDVCNFPLSLMQSRTLKTLNFGSPRGFVQLPLNSLRFAWLKNLQLTRVVIHQGHDLFSGCKNLENLRLTDCKVSETEILYINAPQLVQLIITDLRYYDGLILISAAKLKRFELNGTHNPSTDLAIANNVALDDVKLQINYPLFFRERNEWKLEFRDYIIGLANSIQARTKFFSVTFNFYVGEIEVFRDSFNKEIMIAERNKECNGHLSDKPWD